MSERKSLLISATCIAAVKVQEKNGPSIGEAFGEVANMYLLGSDALYSARVSIPVDQEQELKKLAQEKGYSVDPDIWTRNVRHPV